MTLADRISVSSNLSGVLIAPFYDFSIRLSMVLSVPFLGYSAVSTSSCAEKWFESHFCRKTSISKFRVGIGQ